MYKSTFLKKFKILGEKMINIKFNDYKNKIKSYLGMRMFSMPFLIVNVARLDINVRYIYLWQDTKGHVCYCFDILNGDYFTTSAPKLGNVLSQHFKCEIEVVNNEKEHLKKIRPLPNEWHKTEEGKEHARKNLANSRAKILQFYEKECGWCGKKITARFVNRTSYCDRKCEFQAIQADVNRQKEYECEWCGSTFKWHRKKAGCSKECSHNVILRKKGQKTKSDIQPGSKKDT